MRSVRTTNILERLNREVGRRANVVGVFPNDGSARRLAGSLLIEENDRWQRKRKLYHSPAVVETEARAPSLARIAKRRAGLRKAA
ncbi:transposase [Olsenella uli]|uniref:transposase n=1 Tax=Olsenella uli TaxID=133926 RepID=UPI0012ABF598